MNDEKLRRRFQRVFKNALRSLSLFLKLPTSPPALSLAKHIYSAPLCKGSSLASDMIIFTTLTPFKLLILFLPSRLRGCYRQPLHFHHHRQPLSALKIQIRAAGATIILHSSLFIIHYSSSLISSLSGNTTIPLSLSSSPSCGTFPSHSYPHLFLSQNI